MSKQPPCTIGQKHKWEWVRNTTLAKFTSTSRGSIAHLSLKGLYRCSCGATKTGVFNHNGDDLRAIAKATGGAT